MEISTSNKHILQNSKISLLSISDVASFVETAVLELFQTNSISHRTKLVLSKASNMIFCTPELIGLVEHKQFLRFGFGKPKKSVNYCKRVLKIDVGKVRRSLEYFKDMNGEDIVYIHNILSSKTTSSLSKTTSSDMIDNYLRATNLRIFKQSEGVWRDMEITEFDAYNEFVQFQIHQKLEVFGYEDPYMIVINKNIFIFVNSKFESCKDIDEECKMKILQYLNMTGFYHIWTVKGEDFCDKILKVKFGQIERLMIII